VRPYLKKHPSHKWAGGVAWGRGHEFKPQSTPKKKKEKEKDFSFFSGNYYILLTEYSCLHSNRIKRYIYCVT
jgi:hypothetical protein